MRKRELKEGGERAETVALVTVNARTTRLLIDR